MQTVLCIQGSGSFSTVRNWASHPLIHVERDDKTVKYWLSPVTLASSERFRGHELNRVRAMVIEHGAVFLGKWHEYF